MGTSTVSGPFRSANGFQELVNGEWVPVAGGGGFVPIHLYNQDGPVYGAADNRYSNNNTQNPPTGPTAGTIVQLPQISLGGTYFIDTPTSSVPDDAWALKLPAISGTDLSAFYSSRYGRTYVISTWGVATVGTPEFVSYPVYEPVDTLYIYNGIESSYGWLGITFSNIIEVTGFGKVALFAQSSIPYTLNNGYFAPYIYPRTTVTP